MGLFDKLVETALEKSPTLKQAVILVGALALEMEKFGSGVHALAQIVQAHHVALQELYAKQGLVMKAVAGSSLDMKMPDGKKIESKPN